jgi:hypothetical protein
LLLLPKLLLLFSVHCVARFSVQYPTRQRVYFRETHAAHIIFSCVFHFMIVPSVFFHNCSFKFQLMNTRRFIFIAAVASSVIMVAAAAKAQDPQASLHTAGASPLLTGHINISIRQGTIDCDLSLLEMPAAADNLILLNKGLNIRYIRNHEKDFSYYYEHAYDDNISSEAMGYYIPDNTGKSKYIPKALRFTYTGKFPVVEDTLQMQRFDWKGNIAFNGYSLRMDGRQTGWYPVLFDVANDKRYHEVRYDIKVNCDDCNAIYLNGNTPVKGKTAHFRGDKPTELFLYAGNFDVNNTGTTYFLNAGLSDQEMKEFGDITASFKKYYESRIGIPYRQDIVYVQTTPVSKNNAWLFVSYPTIVNVGHGEHALKKFFGERKDIIKPFIAHELAHYYFGYRRQFNSPIGDMLSEGLTEYMAMQLSRDLLPDSVYTEILDDKIKRLKEFAPVSFAAITNEKQYDDRELYVYNYVPLLLSAIEKEIGKDNMWKWLQTIVASKETYTDYRFLEQTLELALKDKAKAAAIKDKYFKGDATLKTAMAALATK